MNEGLNTLSAADVAAVTRNNDGNAVTDGETTTEHRTLLSLTNL